MNPHLRFLYNIIIYIISFNNTTVSIIDFLNVSLLNKYFMINFFLINNNKIEIYILLIIITTIICIWK